MGVLPERVAVVFVHGQGQQMPMTDVLALAESVWRTDPIFGGVMAPVYSVPVYDGDSAEQRRVVTEEVALNPPIDGHDSIQVDFFQFYWADLMQGSRFAQLWKWFVALVQKSPKTNVVPQAIRPLRDLTLGITWAVSLMGMVLGLVAFSQLAVTSHVPVLKGVAVAAWALAAVLGIWGWLKTPARPLFQGVQALTGTFFSLPLLIAAAVLTPIAVVMVAPPTERHLWAPDLAEALAILFELLVAGIALSLVVFLISRKGLDTAFTLGLLTSLLYLAIVPLAPWARAWWPPLVPQLTAAASYLQWTTLVPVVLVAVLGGMLSRSFLVPVMAESARMFTPSPDNVPNQERVRERGLKLLEFLHGQPYDRIVILAHSLGSAVAYNLLAYYWGKVNGELDHAGSSAERHAVEAHTQNITDFAQWRRDVRAYGAALRRPLSGDRQSPWRIGDFITIGSPLTYAPFLFEEADNSFIDQVQTYRRYPLCPPVATTPGSGSFSFPHFQHGNQPHHAALFAATTWTNLYFPALGLVWGDLIGGRIAGALGDKLPPTPPATASDPWLNRRGLGKGVLDVKLEHDPKLGWFSHNDYWPWPGYLCDDQGNPKLTDAKGNVQAPAHIHNLRAAFHFFQSPDLADQTLGVTPLPPAPTLQRQA